jgi:hypothetical protein
MGNCVRFSWYLHLAAACWAGLPSGWGLSSEFPFIGSTWRVKSGLKPPGFVSGLKGRVETNGLAGFVWPGRETSTVSWLFWNVEYQNLILNLLYTLSLLFLSLPRVSLQSRHKRLRPQQMLVRQEWFRAFCRDKRFRSSKTFLKFLFAGICCWEMQ